MPRPVVWLGNSKRNIRDFPKGAQKLLGDELQLIQFGGIPKDAKPFKQKKSKRGIETPKRDVDLIRKRYAEARELAHEHEKAKTN